MLPYCLLAVKSIRMSRRYGHEIVRRIRDTENLKRCPRPSPEWAIRLGVRVTPKAEPPITRRRTASAAKAGAEPKSEN